MYGEFIPGPTLVSADIVKPRLADLRNVNQWLRNEGIVTQLDIIASQPDEVGITSFTRSLLRMGRLVAAGVSNHEVVDDDMAFDKVDILNSQQGASHIMVPLLDRDRTDAVLGHNQREVEGNHHAPYPSATPAAMIELANLGLGFPIEDRYSNPNTDPSNPVRDPRVAIIGYTGQVGSKLIDILADRQIFPMLVGHSKDEKHAKLKPAELIFGAAGVPNLIAAEYFGPTPMGADDPDALHRIIVDAGVTRDEKGKLSGAIEKGLEATIPARYTTATGSIGPLNALFIHERTAALTAEQAGIKLSYKEMVFHARHYMGRKAMEMSAT
jgi:5,10-methylene-tetrahydrofolate dehydrogenase/methenyl tetrahydrofolate cyclohydrolase